MELKLQRTSMGQMATLGTLDCELAGNPDSVFRCYTLEDVDRRLEANPSAKIPGQTCIPRGRYKVIINMSNRFKKLLPLLLNVPGFEGVRIHTGNTPADTDGCILVGARPTSEAFIPNSRVTFDELFKRMQSALNSGEEVWITIT